MKDITRIHIAKVAYEIELAAKKKLEAYIAQLEAYAQDVEVLEDIEIRITELLFERGIKQNDVITSADVASVCAQLGDPKEFMADGDVVSDAPETGDVRKRLYRNTDTALVGGVLSGVASYFGVNPLWTRLAFVLLTFISVGLSLFVYVLFWLIVPSAKTAAEKLSMAGRPVTLASIRQLNENEVTPNEAPRIVRRVATILIGLTALLTAIGVIAGAIYSVIALHQIVDGRNINEVIGQSIGSNYLITFGLGAIAAATFVVFMILVAYASFKQVFGKQIWMTAIILVALGLTSFGAAVGSAAYGSYDLSVQAAKNIVTKQVNVPKEFASATSLSIKDIKYDAYIEYIVDATPRIEMSTSRDDSLSILVEGERATLKYTGPSDKDVTYRSDKQTYIRVYGPALQSIDIDAASMQYEGAIQNTLTVNVKNAGSVTVLESRIETVSVLASEGSSFDGQSSTLSKVSADMSLSSSLRLGTVASLSVKAPTTCAVNARNEVYAVKVNEGFVTYNDNKVRNTQYEESCTLILSDGQTEIYDQYDN